MSQLKLFKVRDLRKKDQFKIDDAYLNGYARVCKPVATAVYNSLCRHAEFNTQKAFPSQELIAFQHDISTDSVGRAIKKLAEFKIIFIEKERKGGKFMNCIYTLLDKSEWKPIHHTAKTGYGSPYRKNTIRQKTDAVKCGNKDNKDIKDNKIIYKDNKEIASQSDAGSKINLLIERFKPINPSYERLFANKTQRACLERLVKKHGFEKIKNTIEFLPKIFGKPYAPRIVTPYKLEEKLADLISYFKERSEIGNQVFFIKKQ
jgi:hypothetical protein